MKTPIANMILEMHGKGIPVELIAGAVATFEEAMAARAVSTVIPVDTRTIDKRRAWDRERKRRTRAAKNLPSMSTGQPQCPPDIPQFPPDCQVDNASILREVSSIQVVFEKKKESKKEDKAARGTRIPPDFRLTQDDYDFAASIGIPPDAVDAETPQFIDYWIAVPGAKGVKLNWAATWRNRMRDLKKYRDRNGKTVGNYRSDPASGRATGREAMLIAAVGRGAANRLAERGSAGSDGTVSGNSGSAEVFDFGKRADGSR